MSEDSAPIVLSHDGESAPLPGVMAEFGDDLEVDLNIIAHDWSEFAEQDRVEIATTLMNEDATNLVDAFQDGRFDVDMAREIRTAWKRADRRGRWGDVIVNSRSHIPVPVVAAAAPSVDASEVRSAFSWSGSRKAGLKIKLGGLGLDAGAKYTVTDDITVKAVNGEAGLAIVRVPVFRVVRQFYPEGAANPVHVTRYELIRNEDPDLYLKGVAAADLLASSVDESEVDIELQSAEGSQSFSVEIDVVFSFGLDIGGDDEDAEAIGSWSVAVGVEGSARADLSWDLPQGRYKKHRLDNPAGFVFAADR